MQWGRAKHELNTDKFDAYKASLQWYNKQGWTRMAALCRWEFAIHRKERSFPPWPSRSNRLDGIHTGIMSSLFPWWEFDLSHTTYRRKGRPSGFFGLRRWKNFLPSAILGSLLLSRVWNLEVFVNRYLSHQKKLFLLFSFPSSFSIFSLSHCGSRLSRIAALISEAVLQGLSQCFLSFPFLLIGSYSALLSHQPEIPILLTHSFPLPGNLKMNHYIIKSDLYTIFCFLFIQPSSCFKLCFRFTMLILNLFPIKDDILFVN